MNATRVPSHRHKPRIILQRFSLGKSRFHLTSHAGPGYTNKQLLPFSTIAVASPKVDQQDPTFPDDHVPQKNID
jgi:hypothetical protein